MPITHQYITLITALSSATVGGAIALLASYFNNRAAMKRYEIQLKHETEQRRQELLRARGEELYTITSAWLKRLHSYHLRILQVMYRTITYDQANEMEVAEGKAGYDFDRIALLIDAYFPEVRSAYEAMLAENEKAHEIRLIFKRDDQKHGDRVGSGKFVAAYEKAHTAMDQAAEALQKRTTECIRALSG
jgi:hypothetical protein